MVGSRRTVLVVALAVAVVVGVFLPDAFGGGRGDGAAAAGAAGAAGQGAAAVAEWAPAGAAPALVRARGWADSGLVTFTELLRTRAVAHGPSAVVAAAWAALMLAWWVLRGLHAGSGSRLRRSPLPARRAPPALA
jgi:hypothetical protein